MKLLSLLAASVVSVVLLPQLLPASAWAAGEHDKHHANEPAATKMASNANSMTDGEVRKVDKDAKKITLKHGAIRNLEMPAMTMVFLVKDSALLGKVNAGDKVKFRAENVSGGIAVTAIEVTK